MSNGEGAKIVFCIPQGNEEAVSTKVQPLYFRRLGWGGMPEEDQPTGALKYRRITDKEFAFLLENLTIKQT